MNLVCPLPPSPTSHLQPQLPPPFFLGLFQKGELDSERELGFRVVVNPKRRTAAAAAAAADQQRAVLLLIIP